MQAGKLRHRVIPQKSVSVQDPLTGEVVKNWVNIVQSTADNGIWAEVYPLSAREFTSAQATQNEITTRITIRQRNDITLNAAFYIEEDFSTLREYFPS